MGIREKWTGYQPQKGTVVWGFIAGSILTMLVGFMWGGWTTGGSALEMAEKSANAARADVVASVCVNKFMVSSNPRAQQEELLALSSFQQRSFVEKAEWAELSGGLELSRDAASLCAERIAALDTEDLVGSVAEASEQDSVTIEPETAIQ